MELNGIEILLFIADGSNRAGWVDGIHYEPFRRFDNKVAVTHPYNLLVLKVGKQLGWLFDLDGCFPVFTVLGPFYFSTEVHRHELHAVADAKDRDIKVENALVTAKGTITVNAVRATGEDDPRRVDFLDFFDCDCMGMKFAVYTELTDPSCNQLVVLTSKVEYDDHFLIVQFFFTKHSVHLISSYRSSPDEACSSVIR